MKHRIGIALGGGVARGWSHIGVLRTLKKHGIKPDIIAGTSIGSVVGGYYAAGRLDELTDFATSLTRRSVISMLDINLKGSSLLTGRRINKEFESHLGDLQIEDLKKQYIAVASEIGTGHEVWLDHGSLVDAMRASYALPGIFKPVYINGHWLFDGALVDPVPVSVCRAMGATIVIAVNINADVYGKTTIVVSQKGKIDETDLEETDPGIGETTTVSIAPLNWFKSYLGNGNDSIPGMPGLSKTLMEALNITQDRIAAARLAGHPPDIMINPRVHDVGLFDFHQAKEMIKIGTLSTEVNIEHIQRMMELLPPPKQAS